MFSKKLSFPHFLSFVLLFSLLFSRFVKINWGNGFFFNPDENNMASAISQLSFSSLNPHFFSYSQFPLYLVFFTQKLFSLSGYSSAVFVLRFYSALFSVLTVFVFYKLSQIIFAQKKSSLIFVILLIFSPGLIQTAHFGTTESLLILIFALNLYLSLLLLSTTRPLRLIFLLSLTSGIGLASKLTALIFTLPVFLAIFFRFFLSRKFILFFSFSLFFFSTLLFFFLLFSPYNLIEFSDFIGAMRYEITVANGSARVFYTSQFLHTLPYLFQLQKIFPHTSGLPVFILSLFSFPFLIKNFTLKKPKPIILFLSVLVYFLYVGRLYVKWTRFMSPLFFLFPLLATLTLSRLKSKKFFYPCLILAILPGLFFLSRYFSPDSRLQASRWIDQNVPSDSPIFSEAGNVINLPLATKNFYQPENFDFFTLDTKPQAVDDLATGLYQSDYLLIPSRRIFKNQNNSNFPLSRRYYSHLFDYSLGFTPL
ncbi:glycosyltransferase family 39 protein, partial [Patescibacteria group bacterium]|nr:glycosyltransferase family 39 protein [Patescibacteria group bacterium]